MNPNTLISYNSFIHNYPIYYNDDLRVFEISDEQIELFFNTDNTIFLRRLPFKNIFITFPDVIRLYNINNKNDYGHFRAFFLSEMWDAEKYVDIMIGILTAEGLLIKFTWNELMDEMKKKFKRNILTLFSNLLDFINHPKTEISCVNYTKEDNNKRLKHNKLPYPSSISYIRLNKIVNQKSQENSNNISNLKYRFWVRGHYKHFFNKKHFQNLYVLSNQELIDKGYQINNNIISKYVEPFIKGKEGSIYNKRYKLKS